jgi:hypothetical protein
VCIIDFVFWRIVKYTCSFCRLEFGKSCKTCGDTITEFEFGITDPSNRCLFCPQDDMKYPDRVVPFFSSDGKEIKCWQVQNFFSQIDIDKKSDNCQLSQSQNYICGCTGAGYAGANTQTKRNALVWMPRVAAVLSILVRLHSLLKGSQSHILRLRNSTQYLITSFTSCTKLNRAQCS